MAQRSAPQLSSTLGTGEDRSVLRVQRGTRRVERLSWKKPQQIFDFIIPNTDAPRKHYNAIAFEADPISLRHSHRIGFAHLTH